MGLRYRKSIKIVPGVKLNLSKAGVSTSVGKRGATVNFSKRGTRATVGIPGSGLSYSTMVGKRKRNGQRNKESYQDVVNEFHGKLMGLGLTDREASRFIKEVKKHPKRFMGKSDDEIVAYATRRRLTPNKKIFILVLILAFLIYSFFTYNGK